VRKQNSDLCNKTKPEIQEATSKSLEKPNNAKTLSSQATTTEQVQLFAN
jgi:hypothetical protein